MTDELSENWEGTFFEREEARIILNMTADEFAKSLMKNNPKDAKFFLAGAVFDLGWNGLKEKAEELTKVASEKFEGPYEQIFGMISFGKEQVDSGREEENVKRALYVLVGEVFHDRMRMIRKKEKAGRT